MESPNGRLRNRTGRFRMTTTAAKLKKGDRIIATPAAYEKPFRLTFVVDREIERDGDTVKVLARRESGGKAQKRTDKEPVEYVLAADSVTPEAEAKKGNGKSDEKSDSDKS
jgi:hypothetical protein